MKRIWIFNEELAILLTVFSHRIILENTGMSTLHIFPVSESTNSNLVVVIQIWYFPQYSGSSLQVPYSMKFLHVYLHLKYLQECSRFFYHKDKTENQNCSLTLYSLLATCSLLPFFQATLSETIFYILFFYFFTFHSLYDFWKFGFYLRWICFGYYYWCPPDWQISGTLLLEISVILLIPSFVKLHFH